MPALEGSLTFALYLYRGLERRRVSRAFGNYFIFIYISAGQPGFLVNIILWIVGGGEGGGAKHGGGRQGRNTKKDPRMCA